MKAPKKMVPSSLIPIPVLLLEYGISRIYKSFPEGNVSNIPNSLLILA